MSMTTDAIAHLAEAVDTAAAEVSLIPMLTRDAPDLTLALAYTVQRASIARRLSRGEALIGMKMGLTSEAKMRQVGVHRPIYGHLTSAMRLEDGGQLRRAACGHPRAEPEVAFIMGRPLSGQPSPEEALAAVSGVCPAIEIIDSRFENFKFTIIDVVADNASSHTFVLGPATPIADVGDLGELPMTLSVDGEVVQRGSSAAIYGHPARSLATLAAMLDELGESLQPGQIVLAGGATAAVALSPGQSVRVDVEGLGSAGFSVIP